MALASRQKEIKLLNKLFLSRKAELLAIFGRRRVGKTFLVRAFFEKKKCVFFDAAGTRKGAMKDQIFNFTQRMADVFLAGIMPQVKNSWNETFKLLNDLILKVPKNKKVVIFLDELPWMATKRAKLLDAIDYYWNQYWSKESRIKLIVCGSSASWIINKIINNKGGLYNRVTETIHLKPFNLFETSEYLAANNVRLNNKQITELYMITGGVPFYLSKIEAGRSATQAIEALAFDSTSLLFNEFNALFESLFENADAYIEIIKAIAKHHEGMGQEALFKALKKTSKGKTGLKRLKDLEDAGFIMSFIPHFHIKRGVFYRVSDEYSLFYLYWIEPLKNTKMAGALKKGYWKSVTTTPKWFSWSGYAFETICYKHLNQISDVLDLSPTAIPNSWRYAPGPEKEGAQIDLLFDRDDDSITLCEIKFTKKAFEITSDYAKKLKRKVAVFKQVTGTQKQLFVAIISAKGLKKNKYATELIDQIVVLDDLFTEA
jgi:uncharacterized protein